MNFLFKKISVFFLITISIFFLIDISSAYYKDVNESNIHYEAITRLYKDGVLSAKENFRPNDKINKAEFIALLIKGIQMKVDFNDIGPYFDDVPKSHWVNPYIKKAIDIGLLQGMSNFFYPTSTITKVDALRLLFIAFGIKVEKDLEIQLNFKDVSKNDFFAPIVYKAISMDIIQPNTPDFFEPMEEITRGFAAQLLYNIRLVEPIDVSDNVNTGSNIELLQTTSIFQDVEDIWSIIKQQFLYVDRINDQKAKEMAIKGAVNSLGDPYTVYFTKEENQKFQDDFKGEIVGIGVYVSAHDNKIVIISTIKNSPAFKAGLLPGDWITKINGISTLNMSIEDVINSIRGKVGTYVELEINRNNNILKFNVIREKINIPTVILDSINYNGKNIAILEITNFGDNTLNQFKEAVNNILKNNYDYIILDLRNNPGGYLDSSIVIASYFLKNGDLVTKTLNRNGDITTYKVQLDNNKKEGELYNKKMVILQNKGSGSASEVLAGALKDNRNITIIGNKSFGKGVAQVIRQFEDGSSLKITVAKWLRPNGQNIDGVGIPVDIEIKELLENKIYQNKLDDPYIKAGVDFLINNN